MSDKLYTPPLPKIRRFEGSTELLALRSLRSWCERHKLPMPSSEQYKETWTSNGVWIDIPENYGNEVTHG